MGGFEGGDEGGYWDDENLTNPIDKLNQSLLNNTTKRKPPINYKASVYSILAYPKENTISEGSYNTISFVPSKNDAFVIEGYDNIPLESNTIYKAYKIFYALSSCIDVKEFFDEHKVVVSKSVDCLSSDAASFIILVKEVCNLILTSHELLNIGREIDSDVAFFLHRYLF